MSSRDNNSAFDKHLKELGDKIEKALYRHDKKSAQDYVFSALSERSKNVFKNCLPYLDRLFFYEIEKHQNEYKRIVNALIEEHGEQVQDNNNDIRQILVRGNRATLDDLTELLSILSELNTL